MSDGEQVSIAEAAIQWFTENMGVTYPCSKWIYADEGRVYIRHTDYHSIPKNITIANIEIYEEGNGTFKSLRKASEEFAKLHGYVLIMESVHNKRLFDHLVREGYTVLSRDLYTLAKTFN